MELEELASLAEEADDVMEAPPDQARRVRGLPDLGTPNNRTASGGARADAFSIQAMMPRQCPGAGPSAGPQEAGSVGKADPYDFV